MPIQFENEFDLPTLKGRSLLQHALANDIPMIHVCGGHARCSTCRVVILEGELPPRNEKESTLATTLGLPSSVRLACQLDEVRHEGSASHS